jgi:hypothetical protein
MEHPDHTTTTKSGQQTVPPLTVADSAGKGKTSEAPLTTTTSHMVKTWYSSLSPLTPGHDLAQCNRHSSLSECVFLYSSFVLFCVRFRMAVGDQLVKRVFREEFPYFKYCRTKSKSSLLFLFPKVNIARKSFTHC